MAETTSLSAKAQEPVTGLALITPSASPPIARTPQALRRTSTSRPPPSKRQRVGSTHSVLLPPSSKSAASSSVIQPIDPSRDEAWRASSQRLWSVWDSLADRYNVPLDEDDIIDLRSQKIIRDRGITRSHKRTFEIGYFADPADPAASEEDATSEDDGAQTEAEDRDELDLLTPQPKIPIKLEMEKMNRYVPPFSTTNPADAEDLKEFLQAERERKELGGDDDDEDEETSDLGGCHEQSSEAGDAGLESLTFEEKLNSDVEDIGITEKSIRTPRRPSAKAKSTAATTVEDDSEDELAVAEVDYSSPPSTPATKARIIPPEIIDLTTSSPSSCRTECKAPALDETQFLSSYLPSTSRTKPTPRAKSKTRLPTISPPPTVRPSRRNQQLYTPPRSSQSSTSIAEVTSDFGPDYDPFGVDDQSLAFSSPVTSSSKLPPLSRSKSLGAEMAQETSGPAEPSLDDLLNEEIPRPPPRRYSMQPSAPPRQTSSIDQSQKRKRVVSSPSPPLTPLSSPVKGPFVTERAKASPHTEASKSAAPTASKENSSHVSDYMSDEEDIPLIRIHRGSSQRARSQPRTLHQLATTVPYIPPYTPSHRHSLSHHIPQYPPPPVSLNDPQAQHILQAVHYLSYFFAQGALPGAPGDHMVYPQSQYAVDLPHTPKRERPRVSRRDPSSSPVLGPSSSSTYSTPAHHSHPYPYMFDPRYSSASPPPESSSPAQSVLSSPLQNSRRRVRDRSKSRGRRVSFKLDDDAERPPIHIRQEGGVKASSQKNAHRRSSSVGLPPILAKPLKRQPSQGVRSRTFSDVEATSEEDEDEDRSPPEPRRFERGRTPGPPPHRVRSASVRK
ncbi:hypothetical protein PHLCEN_2v9523 [Hermanssonia centrifuga]|uniref:Uncharacterized protein n=1 Tax=Hermanssonia centrifuga TaxID=98765 RepID=A0A2R6NQH0_9APHY|nr:hypothetical protein PHLCEN_2v9523 [Hermanssonia centrifuga]